MKSKEQLMDFISKEGKDRYKYFSLLFKYMPEEIAKELICVDVKKNETLFLAGDPCETVFIVVSGDVIGEAYHKMGKSYSFMDFSKMYIVGDFEVFADCLEYNLSIRVAQDCKLLKISANSYLRWIKHDENALFLRLKDIVTTLTFEGEMDRENLIIGCKERLIGFLVRMYDKEKKSRTGKVRIEMTQAELADKVGFNVRSVQRNIVSLEEEGKITNESGKIVITHEQYLKLRENEVGKERRFKDGKI